MNGHIKREIQSVELRIGLGERVEYRHHKGGRYTIVAIATDEKTLGRRVIYEDSVGTLWDREADDFFGTVTMPRFRAADEDDGGVAMAEREAEAVRETTGATKPPPDGKWANTRNDAAAFAGTVSMSGDAPIYVPIGKTIAEVLAEGATAKPQPQPATAGFYVDEGGRISFNKVHPARDEAAARRSSRSFEVPAADVRRQMLEPLARTVGERTRIGQLLARHDRNRKTEILNTPETEDVGFLLDLLLSDRSEELKAASK